MRLIPAYAGRTPGLTAILGGFRAHPRLRGAHPENIAVPLASSGSSPLTRGAPQLCHVAPSCQGLIPAYAGRTSCSRTRLRRGTAHPRLRGAHQDGVCVREVNPGSSPLTRGAQSVGRHFERHRGLIPAYAGRTTLTFPRSPRMTAHPRLRGAHHQFSRRLEIVVGSSPLTRGAPSSRSICRRPSRLIPAYAGRTRSTLENRGRNRAHPRLRGAHSKPSTPPLATPGSSPLTRGAPHTYFGAISPSGLIPAYAGRTRCRADWAE